MARGWTRYDDRVSHRPWMYAVSSAVLIAGLTILGSGWWRQRVRPPDRWPSPRAALSVEPAHFPEGFGVRRVFIDAGHGAEGNRGNLSSFCEEEQDFTLRVARHVADALGSTGRFETRVSRSEAAVPYADRVREAQQWQAEAFISIHSDVRGASETWSPRDNQLCLRSDTGPGFAVLYSDEGEPELVEARAGLAERIAWHLQRAGFLAYDGAEYAGAYAAGGSAGVFLDRHAADKRIFVLRKTTMPAVLIETHNALHAQEAMRWSEESTLWALDGALTNALVSVLARKSGGASRP